MKYAPNALKRAIFVKRDGGSKRLRPDYVITVA